MTIRGWRNIIALIGRPTCGPLEAFGKLPSTLLRASRAGRLKVASRPPGDGGGQRLAAPDCSRPGDDNNGDGERARVQSEKLAAIGLLAAGAMHEINNPISAIIAYAQFLLRGDLSEGQRGDVERIAAEALRASRIVHNLLTFARPMQPRKIPLDVNSAVQRALDVRGRQLAADHIAVHTSLAPDLPAVDADDNQLEQVFINIINNARDAMLAPNGPRCLTVSTTAYDSTVRVTFDDTGPGIAVDHLDRIFDPFFTTKADGRGTGLGLAVCYGIVREHGGAISAHNLPERGTRMAVDLPAVGETSHDG